MPRGAAGAIALLALTACNRAPEGAPASAAGRSPPAVAGELTPAPITSSPAPAATAAPGAAPFSLEGLPGPSAPARGPLRVEGYPAALEVGMSDAVDAFGFTHEGELAYCVFSICCMQGAAECSLLRGNGTMHRFISPEMWANATERRDLEKRTVAEMRRFAKDEGLVHVPPLADHSTTFERRAPKPTGEWAYGADIAVAVLEVAPTTKPNSNIPGFVKIGGRVREEPPVWVLFPELPPFCRQHPEACYGAQLNGLVLSPDESELGTVMFVHHPSHGASWVPTRTSVHAFAAQIYNDTGMRHHTAKDYAKAQELFTAAVYADPSREVFAYNLACALARQSDARAAAALKHAVAKGGKAVQARAAKDADFAAVRAAPWFKEIVPL